ncbi:protein MODIFYING WALL LIGNIN-1-like [Solanum dulcamara]|uniref:protein MODIFYING WALL LIGNIN-1-like n=1 Tax=Solanum dulcamara TaxID=45834 RepID=UPI0024851CE9|nr:protein MODIFYING WALL LIGNIN-1-like [Solanum dulcamara]
MEKPQVMILSLLVSIFIALGLTSSSLCIAAEFKKSKKKDLRVDGKYCYIPGSSAFGLGIAALTCLFIAQFIGNLLIICSRKFFSREKIEKMSCNKVEKKKHILVGQLFLTLSWMSFGIALILLGTATNMSKTQHFGEGWLNGECYLVKDGVYIGSSILVLVTLSSILGSLILKLRKRNQVEQDTNVPRQLIQTSIEI